MNRELFELIDNTTRVYKILVILIKKVCPFEDIIQAVLFENIFIKNISGMLSPIATREERKNKLAR